MSFAILTQSGKFPRLLVMGIFEGIGEGDRGMEFGEIGSLRKKTVAIVG